MAALPAYDASELVTKAYLQAELSELRAEIKSDLNEGLAAVNLRLDRLFLAWVGGLVVIVSAMVGVAFMG